MAARQDPLGSFNFTVEIDGTTITGFSEVSGLDAEVEVVEYREGGEPTTLRKAPGLHKFSNIILKRGITGDLALWNWMKSVLAGNADRRNLAIALLNEQRNPVARWNAVKAWPVRYQGPAFSAAGNEVGVETLEITHEGLTREL